MKQKVGILTMHRPVNYGSALQAYATQTVLERLGYDAEIIDYIYPNETHVRKRGNPIKRMLRYFNSMRLGFPWRKKMDRFNNFWENHYKLSPGRYPTRESIMTNPPRYDIYLTGSDQVWNPSYIADDDVFLLSFASDDARKISYASSFAKAKVTDSAADLFRKHLPLYEHISVRESNAQEIVRTLVGREAELCLDPSLLLTPEDYAPLAAKSQLRIDEPFILVYVLNYAFNPYPYAKKFVESAAASLGYKVVCIDFSSRFKLGVKNVLHLHDAIGPYEFLWLFDHASIVLTTSFHGTAFALNYGKSVYSIVNDESEHDDRMASLLREVGMDDRIVVKGSQIPRFSTNPIPEKARERLNELRKESLAYLESALKTEQR